MMSVGVSVRTCRMRSKRSLARDNAKGVLEDRLDAIADQPRRSDELIAMFSTECKRREQPGTATG